MNKSSVRNENTKGQFQSERVEELREKADPEKKSSLSFRPTIKLNPESGPEPKRSGKETSLRDFQQVPKPEEAEWRPENAAVGKAKR